MKEIVIVDAHHGGLFLSLIYLFQKRLGFELRKPYGMDWYEQGYFSYANEDFIRGTLTCVPLNFPSDPDDVLGYGSGGMGVPITLQEATDRASEIRFMVSSLHFSEGPFAKFISQRAPKATLIRQCGNPNERVRFTRHALCSDLETYNRIKGTHHAVLYHQEFNTKIFNFRPVSIRKKRRKVRSFLNYLADMKYLRRYWETLVSQFQEEPVDFFMHGCKDEKTPTEGWAGAPKDIAEMAEWMTDMHLLCQLKNWDGFGHILHYSYAIGRPAIVRWGDYEAKLGGLLIEDMKTGIKLSGLWEDDKKKIMTVLESDGALASMCWAARERFAETVDFDRDEERIREWIAQI